MNNKDFKIESLEYGVEIIDNFLKKDHDINFFIYLKEDGCKDLRKAMRNCNLPTMLINYQLNRLLLRHHYNDRICIIYKGRLPEIEQFSGNRKLMQMYHEILAHSPNSEQVAKSMYTLLRDAGYLVYQTTAHCYGLYDIINEQVLPTFNDYNRSLFLTEQFKGYRDQIIAKKEQLAKPAIAI